MIVVSNRLGFDPNKYAGYFVDNLSSIFLVRIHPQIDR